MTELTKYIKRFRIHPVILWMVSGTCLGLSFLAQHLWFLVFPGLVLFWYLSAGRNFLLGGFLAGLLKFLLVMSWIWSVYPIDWLGINPGGGQIVFIGFVWCLIAATLAVGPMTLAAAAHYCSYTSPYAWGVLAASLVGSELLGATLFSLLALGQDSQLHPLMSMGFTGYASFMSGLASGLAVGGVLSLTFATGVLSVFVLRLLLCPAMRWSSAAVVLMLLAVVSGSHLAVDLRNNPSHELKVAAVDTHYQYIPQTETNNVDLLRRIAIAEAVGYALWSNPDAIILPEGAGWSSQFPSDDAALRSLRFRSTNTAVLVDSYRDEQSHLLVAKVFDTESGAITTQEKQHLVPLGEYIPYAFRYLLSWWIGEEWVAEYISQFTIRASVNKRDQSNIPVLFCYESVLASAYGEYGGSKPFVAHLISHGWFNDPVLLWRQQLTMLQVRAIQTRVPIITAGNDSHRSVIIRENGVVTQGIEEGKGLGWSVTVYAL